MSMNQIKDSNHYLIIKINCFKKDVDIIVMKNILFQCVNYL